MTYDWVADARRKREMELAENAVKLECDRIDLLDRTFKFTERYIVQHHIAPSLGILSRRFGTSVRRKFGMTLEDMLMTDSRFKVNTVKSGKTFVSVVSPAISAEFDVIRAQRLEREARTGVSTIETLDVSAWSDEG